MSFHSRMNAASAASSAGRHADALAAARTLKNELLATDTSDPERLGWARDYELRSLYHLGRHEEGLALLEAGEPRPFSLSPKNAAWLHSVGGEMAQLLGATDAIAHHGRRALELRLEDGDVSSAAMAIETTRALLHRSARHDLADAFTDWVEAIWRGCEPGGRRAMDAAMAVSQASKHSWYLRDLPSEETRRRGWILREAAQRGDADAVRLLLAAGGSVDAMDPRAPGLPTALIQASYGGHAEVVQALLVMQPNLRLANVQGRTALHQAADQGHAHIVAALCEAGAPVAAVDFCAHTPLHVACWQDHLDSVRMLVAGGAPLNRGDVNGDAPLALSATEPHIRVCEYLLTVDDHVDRHNHFGQSALHGAAIAGVASACRLLLDAGADPGMSDRNGMTPLAWARQEGHRDAARVLAANG